MENRQREKILFKKMNKKKKKIIKMKKKILNLEIDLKVTLL